MFLFRLALRLGRTVNELERSLSFRELQEWYQFYAIDPFDEMRGDLRSAMMMALTANLNRDRKRRPEPFSHVDFMPFRDAAPSSPSGTKHGEGVRLDPNVLTFLFLKAAETEKKE